MNTRSIFSKSTSLVLSLLIFSSSIVSMPASAMQNSAPAASQQAEHRGWRSWFVDGVRSATTRVIQAVSPYGRFNDERAADVDIEMPEILEHAPIIAPAEQDISARQVASGLSSFIFTRDNAPSLAAATALTGVNMGISFLTPYLSGQLVGLLGSGEETTKIGGIDFTRTGLVCMVSTAVLATQILANLRSQIMTHTVMSCDENLYKYCIGHLLKKSLSYHVNTDFGDQTYLLQKSFSVTQSITPLTELLPTIIELSVSCIALAQLYDIQISTGIIAWVATYAAFSGATAKPILDIRERTLEAGNTQWQYVSRTLKQCKTVHDFGKYSFCMDKIDELVGDAIKTQRRSSLLPQQVSLGQSVISRAATMLMLLHMSLGIESGKFAVQDFVAVNVYLLQISGLMPSLYNNFGQLVGSFPDLRFVFKELLKADEVVDKHPGVPLILDPSRPPSIEFRNVTFSYPPKKGEQAKAPIFNNLSFTILPGQKVAFVSESGAGKTTIFNLLFGHYQADSGEIFIDGQDISQVSSKSVQANISIFAQTANLFKGSIRENILFGATDPSTVTEEKIREIAAQVNLSTFLEDFAEGLDTQVGEEGKALSGGQQQKVALLRGLLKECPIYLFDEITAPFDNESAKQVLRGLSGALASATCLMVTHKLSELPGLDKIFVLEGGKVVAQGTHAQLLASCVLYQQLWTAHDIQE